MIVSGPARAEVLPDMVESEILLACPAFRTLPTSALQALARVGRPTRFRRGERISPLINPPRRLILLLDGMAKLVAPTMNGHERIVYVFRRGDLTGSRVFLDQSSESAYEIAAMTRVDGVVFDLADFLAVGREHPEVLLVVTATFSRRLTHLADRLLAAMSEEVSVRLCRLLLDFLEESDRGSEQFVPLAQPLTHETMANIVGASRPHTSTVLSDLEDRGVVRRQRRTILVRPSGLEAVVRHEIRLDDDLQDGTRPTRRVS